MSYQGAAFKIRCPHCDDYESHEVYKSDQKIYHWGNEEVPMFERIVGRDLHYRNRIRKCSNCKKTFSTVEMVFDYLEGLINEVKKLENENKDLKSSIAEVGSTLIKLSIA